MTDKKKAVLYGIGKAYEENKELLYELFDIIAISDRTVPINEEYLRSYIEPREILNSIFDYIVICSRKYKDSIVLFLLEIGINTDKILFLDDILNCYKNNKINEYIAILSDMGKYSEMNTDKRYAVSDNELLIKNEKNESAGNPPIHYFAQDIWAAKKILLANPNEHYDIGSRIDGFISHLLVFRDVKYIDIRPLSYEIDGLIFVQGDATKLDTIEDNSLESVSCLHAMEHFGLGRYGDPINPDGFKDFASAITSKLKKGGHLYIGVPVGPHDKCIFNAHRIFTFESIIELFGSLTLVDKAVIQGIQPNVSRITDDEYKLIEEYSCGLFEFVK